MWKDSKGQLEKWSQIFGQIAYTNVTYKGNEKPWKTRAHRIKTGIPLPIILFVPLFFQTKLDNIEPGISNNHEIVYSIECVKVFYSGKLTQSIEIYIYIYKWWVKWIQAHTRLDLIRVYICTHSYVHLGWLFTSAGCCAQCSRRDRSNDQ